MSSHCPRVLIVYNAPVHAPDHPEYGSEADVLETVVEVERVLPPEKYSVDKLGFARDPAILIRKVTEWRPDVVFNLFEGEADRSETEIFQAGVLEWLKVPFTGSGPTTMALGRDKIRTKYLLQGAGISSAAFRALDSLPATTWTHGFPAIVKPVYEDASVGIDQGSVVRNQDELNARARLIFERFGGPAIVEQFIPGREFHVNIFEANKGGQATIHIVPPTELVFEGGPDLWPIYSYAGKWNEQSEEFKKTRLDTGVLLSSPLREQVAEICSTTFRLVGMRDYGRVDLRIAPDGQPYVIEVNPNPYLNSIGLVDGLRALNIGFDEFVQGLVGRALARGSRS